MTENVHPMEVVDHLDSGIMGSGKRVYDAAPVRR